MRRSPLILCLLAAASMAAGPVRADEYRALEGDVQDLLPEHTSTHGAWFPRYGPATGTDALTPPDERRRAADAWSAAARRRAAEVSGTQLAADLLFSTAWLYRYTVEDPERFRAWIKDAIAAYASHDTGFAVATLRLGAFELQQGNTPAAEAAFHAVAGWSRVASPTDLDAWGQQRWDAFVRIWKDEFPALEAGVLESQARFADAAKVLEARARDPGERRESARRTARRYAQAAKMYARAADAASASRVMGIAAEIAVEPSQQAEYVLWQVYAKHGVLSRHGVPGPSGAWPGESWESDVRVALDRIDRLPGPDAMNSYSVLGSHAHLAGHDEFALEVYLRAIDNPLFLDAARLDPSLLGDLTVGVLAAIFLGRLDEAERLLDLVVNLKGAKPILTDELHAEIQKLRARRRAEHHDARQPRPAEPTVEESLDVPIEPGIRPPRDDSSGPIPRTPRAEETDPVWPYALGALLLSLLAVVLWVRRR